jgi:hypothetical protein
MTPEQLVIFVGGFTLGCLIQYIIDRKRHLDDIEKLATKYDLDSYWNAYWGSIKGDEK